MNSKLDLILDNMMNEVKSIHPHKYILLLSITHLYNVNPNRDNRINIDEVINIFNYIAERFFGEHFLTKNAIEYPFFYLVNNKFWFLKIKKDKDEIYNDIIKNKNSRFTLKRIREVIEYAYLSEGMHHNFQNKNFRKKLAEKMKHVCMYECYGKK